MTYPDSVRYLYSLGNELKTLKFGLETIGAVTAALGYPERACRFVHVAGTNGKGSTCAMIESIAGIGYSYGPLHPPHLAEPTERIRIGGEAVTETTRLLTSAQSRRDFGTSPDLFETVTAMAFVLFKQRQVDRRCSK